MISITVDGVAYDVPSSAQDTNWQAKQVAFEQALATAINKALAVPEWTAVSVFTNSWANVGGEAPAAYYLDPFSMAHLRFTIDSGTAGIGTPAFTLPSAYRPPYALRFCVNCNDNSGPAVVHIATTGAVAIEPLTGDPTAGGVTLECSFSVVSNP